MKRNYFKLLALLCSIVLKSNFAHAQDAVWTLAECIAYAKEHNLTIKQNILNERVAKMQWEQSKLSVLPAVTLSSSYGRNFGRSIDPTTNSFNGTTYDFTGVNGNANILIFGWFRTRNTIAKNSLLLKAAAAELSQLENDIALNVAAAYLRILLANDQLAINRQKLGISRKQVDQTASLLTAGRSNGLDLAQVKTQLVTDSADYFKAELVCQQATIDLKALLNLDMHAAFIVKAVDNIELNSTILLLDPEQIYLDAVTRFGSIKGASLRAESLRKDLAIARSSLYPQLNFSASSGTNYSSTYTELSANGEKLTMPLGSQFENNFSQSVYIGLSIPLFNGLSSRFALKQAKTNVERSNLQVEESRIKLKQDIYKACYEAKTALQTCIASRSASLLAQTGLEFAQKRYEKGLLNAIELLIAQNASFKANTDETSAKYDLIFKVIITDYYRGKQLAY
ncbi:MAG: TolC family protein [Sphingobacteriales bacterium]|nr:MAG: TolC family protein [Sphingobacteriales bacterium]